MRLVFQLLLWIVIIFLGYLVFNTVYEPIQFDKVKEKRYAKVIDRLRDIRTAQLAHEEVTGTFAKDFPGLIKFIDTAKFVNTQRRDTTVLDQEYKKTYGVDKYKDIVLIDTLGYTSVKDSLFKNSDRYKNMMDVPVEGANAKFEMDAGSITKNDSKIPVFVVKIAKDKILYDQNKDLVNQEDQVISVDGVNGEYIQVGSMEEVNTSGNWPTTYGAND